MQIIRKDALLKKTGLSYPTIWRYERDGNFPRKRKLGPNAVGWIESEIDQWIAERMQGGCEPRNPRGRAA